MPRAGVAEMYRLGQRQNAAGLNHRLVIPRPVRKTPGLPTRFQGAFSLPSARRPVNRVEGRTAGFPGTGRRPTLEDLCQPPSRIWPSCRAGLRKKTVPHRLRLRLSVCGPCPIQNGAGSRSKSTGWYRRGRAEPPNVIPGLGENVIAHARTRDRNGKAPVEAHLQRVVLRTAIWSWCN